uniref:Uncharacterized protein n=1 Tax=Romanomermis culicivorax TaxID=13658 RepID=A0A915IC04_ROMCU
MLANKSQNTTKIKTLGVLVDDGKRSPPSAEDDGRYEALILLKRKIETRPGGPNELERRFFDPKSSNRIQYPEFVKLNPSSSTKTTIPKCRLKIRSTKKYMLIFWNKND